MVRRLREKAVDDTQWEEFKTRCQQNPVYRKMRSMITRQGYEVPEVIYWDDGHLSFVLRPTSEDYLPTIYYESSRGFRVDVPGDILYTGQDFEIYSDGIKRAHTVYQLISSLQLEDLEHA